jgi:hypothetical protein
MGILTRTPDYSAGYNYYDVSTPDYNPNPYLALGMENMNLLPHQKMVL